MNLTRASRLIPAAAVAALPALAALALTPSPALASGHSMLRADLLVQPADNRAVSIASAMGDHDD